MRTILDDDGELLVPPDVQVERDIPFVRAYGVFSVEQIEGLPEHYYHRSAPVSDPVKRIDNADSFFTLAGADLRHGGA